MAKVAVLVPNQELELIAQPLTEEFSFLQVMEVKYIRTAYAVQRARELEQQGCDLIVARGVQARLIKRSVRIPLVEITVTPQELASVMLDLKEELELDCPRIGLIGFPNMFSDTSQFNRLFHIDLRLYMAEQEEQLEEMVDKALQDGCNAVIGGNRVCASAGQKALPYKFIPSGEESLRNALATASRVGYAIDLEKHNSAEINALLNYTFSGIIQVDKERIIRRVNRVTNNLLGRSTDALLGQEISAVLPNLNQNVLTDALLHGREAYAFLLDIDHRAVVVNVAPILVGEQIEGAVLTFQEGQRLIEMDSEMRRELYQRGFVARYTFETQYKLLCLIRGRFLHNGPSRPAAAHVRVIASTSVNLIARVEKGEFRSDLYYALSVLTVEVLPLRRRRGDIEGWMQRYLDEWQEKYKRYVSLTQGAWQYLREYEWPGNLDQLYSVCERLVLLTQKRNIDEIFLREQLEQMAPRLLPGTEQVVLYQDRRAVELAALMKKHKGNRQKVAEELGISKTTLWRYLKKYDVHPDSL